MAPFISKTSTACWRSCPLFLVRKLTHWWVSWGRCWNAMPTPSSAMPVAGLLSSRLRQCGAKSARRAPTWDPSTLSGRRRRWNLVRLLAAVGVGSAAGSPAGTSWKGRLLCHCSLVAVRDPSWSKTGVLEAVFLDEVTFVLDLGLTVLLGERDWRPSHPVGLPDGTYSVLKDLGLWT